MNPLISKIVQVQKDVVDIFKEGVIGISDEQIHVRNVEIFKQVITGETSVQACLYGGSLHITYYDKENDVTWVVLV